MTTCVSMREGHGRSEVQTTMGFGSDPLSTAIIMGQGGHGSPAPLKLGSNYGEIHVHYSELGGNYWVYALSMVVY